MDECTFVCRQEYPIYINTSRREIQLETIDYDVKNAQINIAFHEKYREKIDFN
jgi:hypothetical protein